MTFTARLRSSCLLLVMLLLTAEELRGEPRRDAGLLTSLAMSPLPFYLAKGTAEVQLLVTAVWADAFGSTLDVTRRGKSDVILGQRTEQISEVLKLRPGTRDGNPDYARDRRQVIRNPVGGYSVVKAPSPMGISSR